MTPSHHHVVSSPLGSLTLVADDAEQLCGLYMPNHRGGPDLSSVDDASSEVIERAASQLEEYFAGERTAFDLPIATAGSPLEERVWAVLARIPYAATTTYGQIATDLGLGLGASRAVGTANGRNPVSIIVPCHRVVGASGSLTGYAGGLAAKRQLLDLEARTAGTVLFV